MGGKQTPFEKLKGCFAHNPHISQDPDELGFLHRVTNGSDYSVDDVVGVAFVPAVADELERMLDSLYLTRRGKWESDREIPDYRRLRDETKEDEGKTVAEGLKSGELAQKINDYADEPQFVRIGTMFGHPRVLVCYVTPPPIFELKLYENTPCLAGGWKGAPEVRLSWDSFWAEGSGALGRTDDDPAQLAEKLAEEIEGKSMPEGVRIIIRNGDGRRVTVRAGEIIAKPLSSLLDRSLYDSILTKCRQAHPEVVFELF
jgi:hypothetical protein